MTTSSIDTDDDEASGRARQRRRTRTAIVAATTRLLQEGRNPSMSDIAEAADVSRRTVYLHFPTLEQLLIDATVGALSEHAVSEAIRSADPGGDVDARVAAMIGALAEQSNETLALGRQLVRLTLDAPADADGGQPRQGPRRGYRRVSWIEEAVDPLRPRLTPEAFERLVSGLAMVVGWEALIVLGDVRGLAPEEQRSTSVWAARALIAAALADGEAVGRDGSGVQ